MNDSSATTVAVIGGGITGLTAARRIRNDLPTARVLLLESEDRLGGKVLTNEIAGVPVEAGADWFITRQPAALELVRELGLHDELVTPRRAGAYIWTRKKLRRLRPDMVRGVPMDPFAAARAGLLSPQGALRANKDLLSKAPLSGPDVSIGEFIRRRLGDEVMERLVDPMLAASRSGSADDMSLEVAAPELNQAARSNRSLLRGLRSMERPGSSGPPFLGIRGGMDLLIDKLRLDLSGVEIRTGSTVTTVEARTNGYGLEVEGETINADALVMAVPPFAAANLLRHLDPTLRDSLQKIQFAPAIVLTLVYPTGAGSSPREGSGMLVPSSEGRLLTACAWFSEKWEHAQPADGSLVLRCFVGRADAASLEDEALVTGVERELRTALGLAGPPREWHVKRWEHALPVFRVGHSALIEGIEGHVARSPGLELAGAGYRGSGLPDCISDGDRAGRAVVAYLGNQIA